MRGVGTFEIRTAFMCIIASIFYIWQILEIKQKRREEPSSQLAYMQYASSAELFFAFGRLFIVAASSFTIRQVEQIPQILILFTITQLVMNTLSYIAIGGYWSEKIAFANAKSRHENEEIKSLLQEREALIGSLLKANKTASTSGALSASIAHELNQPLGHPA
jgi:C4-dicarboxylate-specific signal transduction histidine kinase